MTTREWGQALATERLIKALESLGYSVEATTSGDVIVDGEELDPEAWDRAVMEWDGTDDGLIDLGWERKADARR